MANAQVERITVGSGDVVELEFFYKPGIERESPNPDRMGHLISLLEEIELARKTFLRRERTGRRAYRSAVRHLPISLQIAGYAGKRCMWRRSVTRRCGEQPGDLTVYQAVMGGWRPIAFGK